MAAVQSQATEKQREMRSGDLQIRAEKPKTLRPIAAESGARQHEGFGSYLRRGRRSFHRRTFVRRRSRSNLVG